MTDIRSDLGDSPESIVGIDLPNDLAALRDIAAMGDDKLELGTMLHDKTVFLRLWRTDQ